jgi:hypothetical protein
MAGVSVEFMLMLGYAFALALIVFLLELAAGHARRRSLGVNTAGSTYHPGQDVWKCPQDQHLFPIFSDSAKGITIYRAPADSCNSCRSKAAYTDSTQGREIERNSLSDVESGIAKFHRALSLTLLVLASLILVVELFRAGSPYPRVLLASTLMLFCTFLVRLSVKLSQSGQHSPVSCIAGVAVAEVRTGHARAPQH